MKDSVRVSRALVSSIKVPIALQRVKLQHRTKLPIIRSRTAPFAT